MHDEDQAKALLTHAAMKLVINSLDRERVDRLDPESDPIRGSMVIVNDIRGSIAAKLASRRMQVSPAVIGHLVCAMVDLLIKTSHMNNSYIRFTPGSKNLEETSMNAVLETFLGF